MKQFFIFLILVVCICCNDDDLDCSTVLCAQSSISVQLVAADTNENVFDNGTFNTADVQVIDSISGISAEFEFQTFIGRTQLNILLINGSHQLRILIPDELDLELSFDAAFENANVCCPNLDFTNFTTTGTSIEMVEGDDFGLDFNITL